MIDDFLIAHLPQELRRCFVCMPACGSLQAHESRTYGIALFFPRDTISWETGESFAQCQPTCTRQSRKETFFGAVRTL